MPYLKAFLCRQSLVKSSTNSARFQDSELFSKALEISSNNTRLNREKKKENLNLNVVSGTAHGSTAGLLQAHLTHPAPSLLAGHAM